MQGIHRDPTQSIYRVGCKNQYKNTGDEAANKGQGAQEAVVAFHFQVMRQARSKLSML
jgi:hypothetical protein